MEVAVHDRGVVADQAVPADGHVLVGRERDAVVEERPLADAQTSALPCHHFDRHGAAADPDSPADIDAAVVLNENATSQTDLAAQSRAATQLPPGAQDLHEVAGAFEGATQ